MKTYTLLENSISTQTGRTVGSSSEGDQNEIIKSVRAFSVSGSTTSGAGSATVIFDVSNDGSVWIENMSTAVLTLSTTAIADGFVANSPYKFVRARVTAISGTGAKINAMMSVES